MTNIVEKIEKFVDSHGNWKIDIEFSDVYRINYYFNSKIKYKIIIILKSGAKIEINMNNEIIINPLIKIINTENLMVDQYQIWFDNYTIEENPDIDGINCINFDKFLFTKNEYIKIINEDNKWILMFDNTEDKFEIENIELQEN